ncbi:serine/threonine-protein kinase [Luteitalea pratensis]|uniref:serine/threonine-protein kinase n=1 Tax=Luteitalea pratensis TaxID=1855912 RepID=UPI00138FFE38|nr:serine/threonine-protein kinase [Luteitalea pratensis]
MARSTISHYRIVRKLGSGGMGEVFLAEDTTLGRKVAIKMLLERSVESDLARRRLINEAKAAAALDHPNICAIHEVGEEDDCVFIVMQYIDGESLAERIGQHALAPAEVVDIGIQAAQALEAAHTAGVIHRDIKPQNIIVTPRGQLKVLDFGLAKLAAHALAETQTSEPLTVAGSLIGTPAFMSPEQLRGLNADARSDIYALGVTLYQCATGRSAFGGGTLVQVAMQVMSVTPPPPSELNPAMPPALDAIIARAMAKDAAARYDSARSLHHDLRGLKDALDGSTVRPAVTAPSTTNVRRRFVRFKTLVAACAIAVLLAAWFASGLLRRGRHVPPPEAVAWYDRGTSAIREGAYFQASKALERALAIDNDFPLARARRAEAYAEMGLTDRAREDLLQAMALLPDRSQLSDAESNYVDAVAATLGRNFTTAIDKYALIADSVGGSDKSAAYVDLGRAYEKNEDLDRAIASYVKATQLDPQSAAAFLRAGILHGRRQQLPPANEAFSKAEGIYRAMSNQEGLAEVHYQRGALLARLRRLPEAKAQLEQSLTMSRASSSEYQAIRTSLQLSNVYYATGDSTRAEAIAADAVKAAQLLNSRTLATNGLIDLGYTLLARGEFASTREYLNQALDLARQDKSPRLEARARLALGSLGTQDGTFDDAVSHLEAALKFYQPAGYRTETSNALILLGRAYRDKGEYAVAMKAFSEQLELAKQSGDPARLAATHSSIGALLGENQEQYAEALPYLAESYRINTSLGARVSMGWDQANRAASLAALGRYDEAATALDEARAIAAGPDARFKSQLAHVEVVGAQIALSLGDRVQARTRAAAALSLADPDYKDTALQARQTLALTQVGPGAPKTALTLVEHAVGAARALKIPRLLSTALLASAEVRLASGDGRGALADAQAAQRIFSAGGQLESEWRAWLVSARAMRLEGDSSAASDYAVRAETTRAALQARWGDDNYRGYAQRHDIQGRLKELAQVLERTRSVNAQKEAGHGS